MGKSTDHGQGFPGMNNLKTQSFVKEHFQALAVELKEVPWHLMLAKTKVSVNEGVASRSKGLGNFLCDQPRHRQMLENSRRKNHIYTAFCNG